MAAEGYEQPPSGSAPATSWIDALQRAGERLLKHFLEQNPGAQVAAHESGSPPTLDAPELTDPQDTEPAVLAIEERRFSK